ncbi:hypothetical protein GJ744_004423 [Endocarpon pusillum]|uniref:BTB domain-containing protein n=1 Tax=Endocarpon pusillum TaxID=364733 RepID=A0A8H7ARY6_9EURO|nr:hypothetical protein GJ744_004423 [Endocarpon pusillum]
MLDFDRVLRSPPFRFFVGKDRTCLTVPKCLAKDLSDPLHAMMTNEHMEEARKGEARLEDVEESTFVGFCEFAYTGDYRSRVKDPEPDVQSNNDAPSEEEAVPAIAAADEKLMAAEALAAFDSMVEEAEQTSFVGSKKVKKVKKGKKQSGTEKFWDDQSKTEKLWDDFKLLRFDDSVRTNEQPAPLNSDPSISHRPTASLLYHVKLYVFAQKYLIHKLRILALRHLHGCLRNLALTKRDTGDILEILEFAYTNTDRGQSNDDDLRRLIVHYAACEADILKQDAGLRGLLEEYGELACDLFYKS